ncbi:PAS domain-containing protein [Ferrovibrio terrae]|uniref:PAS domain-containing protein n=1 Tax=Ferrovibrio terrae TaxID=2594003 RepID=A0A516GX70_9PROT|nr:PAS domain-containing protein [Ferrovibrio terrae]QDO96129.1 PAS domain-containing protein [Ferrovibrio terrae]
MTALDLDSATPRLRLAFEYWAAKCGSRPMPSRADLDPAEIKPLLPYLILMDVLRDAKPGWTLDFRYRLIGTVTDAMMNARYTGKWMSELPHQQPDSRIWQNLASVTDTRQPHISRVPYVGPHKDFMSVVDLVMPLSADGTSVNMLFCIVDFVPRETPAYP